jgi:hypothetical protein
MREKRSRRDRQEEEEVVMFLLLSSVCVVEGLLYFLDELVRKAPHLGR